MVAPSRPLLGHALSGVLRCQHRRPVAFPTITKPAVAAAARQPPPRQPATTRSFSTTPSLPYKNQTHSKVSGHQVPKPTGKRPDIPPYPYGERRLYKQSNTGLYGSAQIRFGNVVSERNEIKTRRKWRPNVQLKRLWSQSLAVWVRTRVTTRVLRTIDKCGGLDPYLLGEKPQRVKDLGPWGWRLRWCVMRSPAVKEMYRKQAVALGLLADDGNAAAAAVAAEAEAAAAATAADLPAGVASVESLLAETQKKLDGGEELQIFSDSSLAEEAEVVAAPLTLRKDKSKGLRWKRARPTVPYWLIQ